MRIEEIRFVERDTPYGTQQGTVMPGGFWVQKHTMLEAWKQVHQNWQWIDWSVKQSAEMLIGPDYWNQQKYGARLALGRCISFFNRHDSLPIPLKVANPGKKGKRYYLPR